MGRRRALLVSAVALATLAGVEGLYRLYLRVRGIDAVGVWTPDEVLERAWFEPHPYLVYTFKPNAVFEMRSFARPVMHINAHGFRSTGRFDVAGVDNPAGALRVATLGGSTTMGVNADDEIWPFRLGEALEAALPGRRIEVLNEGMMGYTSLDNLIDLALRVIDFDCDVYVLYLGVNDLLPLAPPGVYRSDHAHFRKTLYESLSRSPASALPAPLLRLATVRLALQLMGVPDSRNLLANAGTPQFRRDGRPRVEGAERAAAEALARRSALRNVRSMVGVIRAQREDALILLSSFYDRDGRPMLAALNREFETLARELSLVWVDLAGALPRDERIAYDYGHFTPEGDRRAGGIFAAAIAAEISRAEAPRLRSGDVPPRRLRGRLTREEMPPWTGSKTR
jgi:lysophospholipase L1-like esterase